VRHAGDAYSGDLSQLLWANDAVAVLRASAGSGRLRIAIGFAGAVKARLPLLRG
jgi:hypothetical protein